MEIGSLVNNDEELNELLIGCKNNELKYQAKFYSKYYFIVYNTCKKYVKVSCDAEDITQEVFIKLMNKLHTFNGKSPGQFVNWLKMVSKNSTVDILRTKKTFINIDDISLDMEFDSIDLNIIDGPDTKMECDIKNSISKLSPQSRRVFELYYLDNYSHQEIADELNINVGTSKSNLFKAKMKLAQLLKQYNNNFN
jgi:RNA polymerase sigma-70 factor (ECF subfamily)